MTSGFFSMYVLASKKRSSGSYNSDNDDDDDDDDNDDDDDDYIKSKKRRLQQHQSPGSKTLNKRLQNQRNKMYSHLMEILDLKNEQKKRRKAEMMYRELDSYSACSKSSTISSVHLNLNTSSIFFTFLVLDLDNNVVFCFFSAILFTGIRVRAPERMHSLDSQPALPGQPVLNRLDERNQTFSARFAGLAR